MIGAHFRADAWRVHQLLKNFLLSETAEIWIKGLEHFGDGRRDMIALRNHYGGEGNASCRITIAERMHDNLHYRSEHTLSFSIFFDRMQCMLNIYEEEDEPFTKKAKVTELFKRVQHRDLQGTVKALKVRLDLEGLTHTQVPTISWQLCLNSRSTTFPGRSLLLVFVAMISQFKSPSAMVPRSQVFVGQTGRSARRIRRTRTMIKTTNATLRKLKFCRMELKE